MNGNKSLYLYVEAKQCRIDRGWGGVEHGPDVFAHPAKLRPAGEWRVAIGREEFFRADLQ